MNVAFYAPMKPPNHPTPSGDRKMAKLLIAAWQGSGHHVQLASRFRSYDKGNPSRQLRLKKVGEKMAGRLIDRYHRGPANQRPDLWFTYHLYHKAPDWLGPIVSDALKIPYVVAEASYAPKQASGPWDLGHRATAQTLAKAKKVIGFNQDDSECLKPLLANPERQVIVPPFIDTAAYQQASAQRTQYRENVSQQCALDMAEPWLLCVAMMRHDQKLKSYQLLGEALTNIVDRPWRLLVAGSGPARADVKKALAPLGQRVCWLGDHHGDQLPALYAAADIFVWPAIKEAYGMVFLEALSTGLPVVAGCSAGVEGIVSNNTNGILVPLGDAQAFGAAVSRLLDNPAQRHDMARAAHRAMTKSHGIEQMSSFLGNLAEEVTSGAY